MRIPRAHDLTLRYCDLFGLPMRPFVMGNPKALVHLGGQRMTKEEADRDPGRLPFEVAEHERGRTADDLWESAIGDLRRMVEHEGDAAWEHIVRELDQYSLYEFLRFKGWSAGAIEYFTVINFLEADMHNSLVEILREDIGGAYVDMQEIAGGMDGLPNAFYEQLKPEVRFGANVYAIDQDHGRCDRPFQDRVRPVQRPGRPHDRHASPSPSSGRSRSSRPSRMRSSGRSASSTITPPRRSCSRSGTGSGRRRTASSAAARSPSCRSAG